MLQGEFRLLISHDEVASWSARCPVNCASPTRVPLASRGYPAKACSWAEEFVTIGVECCESLVAVLDYWPHQGVQKLSATSTPSIVGSARPLCARTNLPCGSSSMILHTQLVLPAKAIRPSRWCQLPPERALITSHCLPDERWREGDQILTRRSLAARTWQSSGVVAEPRPSHQFRVRRRGRLPPAQRSTWSLRLCTPTRPRANNQQVVANAETRSAQRRWGPRPSPSRWRRPRRGLATA